MHSPPQPSASPQRRPSQEGVHAQESGEPPQVSPSSVHRVPGAQVPPQPSLGLSPQGRVEGAVHVGAQQAPLRQRSPEGHIVPLGHIAQPGASTGSTPQASVPAAAQLGQHEPPVQVAPPAQTVPTPQLRQTAPVLSR